MLGPRQGVGAPDPSPAKGSCVGAGRNAEKFGPVRMSGQQGPQSGGQAEGRTVKMQRVYKLHFRDLRRQRSTGERLTSDPGIELSGPDNSSPQGLKGMEGEILDLDRGWK